MIYLKIIFLALALFVLLRSLSAILSVLTINSKIKKIFLKIFPVFEMFLWLSYALWALYYLFHDSAVYPVLSGAIVIVLVAVFGWYLLRDFISGVILKAENAFEPGQYLITKNVSGTIIKLGYLSIELESLEGELIKIPYSQLSSENIIRPANRSKGSGQVIELKVSTNYQAEKIQSMFERRILEMPWVVPGKNIDIKISRKDENIYLAEIHFRALNSEMAMKTEENLRTFVTEVFSGK